MPKSVSRKRPWLAALLAALVTGLGHLYLRRWRRAIGWLVVSILVSVVFVDPAAGEELMTGTPTRETLVAVAPMLIVVGLNILDAYLLARMRHTGAAVSASGHSSDADEADEIACPHCGKALDPDLEFCHWCTRPVEDAGRDRPEGTED